MQGKDVRAKKIPDINNEKEVEEFYNYARYISPDSYLAQVDNIEEYRIVINKASEYQNYKNIISQVSKSSKKYSYLSEYFDNLYPIRDKIFKNQGSEIGIMRSDIHRYIDSDEFRNLPNLIKNIKSGKNFEDEKSK